MIGKKMRSVEEEMTKQKWAEPHIPAESSKLWVISAIPTIPETLIEAGNNEDVFGDNGLLPEQKITTTLRMLAYEVSADQVDKIVRMGKSTILES
ncbi:hypothetical protein DVH24_005751 [Malus domestica]|uniref:Uncharacterized protein n=1 Tax=Malus domestica TaxID=3750 RepID=A0A498IIW4_MALDO|nr:hypothetical protein DVH24_005751 [Malus domestica]